MKRILLCAALALAALAVRAELVRPDELVKQIRADLAALKGDRSCPPKKPSRRPPGRNS